MSFNYTWDDNFTVLLNQFLKEKVDITIQLYKTYYYLKRRISQKTGKIYTHDFHAITFS